MDFFNRDRNEERRGEEHHRVRDAAELAAVGGIGYEVYEHHEKKERRREEEAELARDQQEINRLEMEQTAQRAANMAYGGNPGGYVDPNAGGYGQQGGFVAQGGPVRTEETHRMRDAAEVAALAAAGGVGYEVYKHHEKKKEEEEERAELRRERQEIGQLEAQERRMGEPGYGGAVGGGQYTDPRMAGGPQGGYGGGDPYRREQQQGYGEGYLRENQPGYGGADIRRDEYQREQGYGGQGGYGAPQGGYGGAPQGGYGGAPQGGQPGFFGGDQPRQGEGLAERIVDEARRFF